MNGARRRFILVVPLVLASTACAVDTAFDTYPDFWSWYIGKPGFNSIGAPPKETDELYMGEARWPWYLHFRTPELIFQPAGGLGYPYLNPVESMELVWRTYIGNHPTNQTRAYFDPPGTRTSLYYAFDAGLLDIAVPYREFGSGFTLQATFSSLIVDPFLYVFGLIARVPAYVFHDVEKTLVTPYAALHFMLRRDSRDPSLSEPSPTETGP